ncbi:ThiF family adenylyltransferase [Yersinia similis]|uniref:Thiazole biosynthesis adenylyltransferase ThiF n=1 Tax=Yersinia similis TaxID=367190 RepID=A0A0T9QBB7_9GAMM|nr:ThiF family adenylyltransferase [Yersinia similis]CNB85412.1 thiazole biosynthesis adenylyltransferase ThiF [Yersinia similis]CNG60479.1 thiazole biosynthesis adenylyltransferase ThiF [Yersinia similis]CNI03885.1 thiazole biosynthesis adenylyltransferase ThiF [Yersinia similis]
MRIQLNRALPLTYDKSNKKIVAGQTFHDLIEIDDSPDFLYELLTDLNVETELSIILNKYKIVAEESSYDINEIIENLLEEKIIIHVWQPDRYDRHRLFFELSKDNHETTMSALSLATVGIMGTGGIGSNVAILLAAAGVGKLKISDGDLIEESNLTRATIFKEDQIGSLKVASLKENISERNKICGVEVLPLLLNEENMDKFNAFFSECDIIVLSADPNNVFELISIFHDNNNIPIVNAGYLGRLGLIGPMMDATSNPGFKELFTRDCEENRTGKILINRRYQAPSYGPLNYMVSSICSHEVIRYLATRKSCVWQKRLLINPDTYETLFYDYKITEDNIEMKCDTLKPGDETVFNKIAGYYREHRDTSSTNKTVLDKSVARILIENKYNSVLDVGCGIGTYCRMLDGKSSYIVGLDINSSMLSTARELGGSIEYSNGEFMNYHDNHSFDLVIFSLVLDHVENFVDYILKAKSLLHKGGSIVCIIPNPVKDSCLSNEGKYMEVTNYFHEGVQRKNRYDVNDEILCEVLSFKRTLPTYLNAFLTSGFTLHYIEEPRHPDSNHRAHHIPYFTILEFRYEH